MTIMTSLSPRATAAPESGIVEVVNYARGREGLIPLWVGEGDLPTPDFVSRAAADALMAGLPRRPGVRRRKARTPACSRSADPGSMSRVRR